MKITHLRVNHLTNPLGFDVEQLSLSWITESEDTASSYQRAARVEIAYDSTFEQIAFDSGEQQHIDSLAYVPDLALKVRTRYYWRVTVWGDAGEVAVSDAAWFETAKMDEAWQGNWIAPSLDKEVHPLLRKQFELPESLNEQIVKARVYISGVGLYELEVNGQRVGDEFLAPGYHSYNFWLQYQSYDVTALLKTGHNVIGTALGNGWYKGRFGFGGGHSEWYGDQFALLAELIVTLKDGSEVIIATDATWKCAASPVQFSNIYDGECYDATKRLPGWSSSGFDDSSWQAVEMTTVATERMQARINPPIKIMEEIKPIELIHTPAGETVLDFGQNMTGWVRFKTSAAVGSKLHLQYGEILQNDNFYQDNLRTAKAEYIYITDGLTVEVQPQFTFFGFRYVKLQGFDEFQLEDFTACVVHSELVQTGTIETSNPLVNRLFKNAVWGQRGNFLDVPTDCPQRDERMGWTGDAQVFAPTACFNMYSAAFYKKYMVDLREEQLRRNGSVPFTVPAIKSNGEDAFGHQDGSAAWGDAATVIPWTLYLNYGDKELLRSQFDTMKDWVDYIKGVDEQTGGKRLWQAGFHFADWLALDNYKDPKSPLGGTDPYYLASAYYCYSAQLVAKAAAVLEMDEVAKQYEQLVAEIKAAVTKEYFTPSGKCAIPTQTALVVALYMDLVPQEMRARVFSDLQNMLKENHMHLTTGFVGTPYLALVLSEHGDHDAAYSLLLNEEYPGWLYAVNLGATTIWERWNSVLEDGSISDTGMNSLNHYAYGSIAQWMYQYMCGINPVADAPGYRRIKLAPKPSHKLSYAKASFQSPTGLIESGWSIETDGSLTYRFTVPFHSSAEVVLPDAELAGVTVNGTAVQVVEQQCIEGAGQQAVIVGQQQGSEVSFTLKAGSYVVRYMPTRSYVAAN